MTKIIDVNIKLLFDIEDEGRRYSHHKKSAHKKEYGQFFTHHQIANFMSELFTINPSNSKIEILDCGAGNGILAISLIHKLEKYGIKTIHVTLYEIDPDVVPLLKTNIIKTITDSRADITFDIIQENFILADIKQNFDYIISNPPYFKLNKESIESKKMDYIVHGQPNIYGLFMAKSAELLKPLGEMVFITPRSFTTGKYFSRLREYILALVSLTHIHIFHSRTKHFKNENILQETIITKFTKQPLDRTLITVSEDSYFHNTEKLELSKKELIGCHDSIIRIPTSREDLKILDLFMNSEDSFASLGFKISTGKVVVFRNREFLLSKSSERTVPMLWMNNFKDEQLIYPLQIAKPQYLIHVSESKKLLIPCENYLVIKRFSSKEQKRRINIGFIYKKDMNCNFLGLENHLNYIYKVDGDFTDEEMKKLGEFLSSEIVDKYFRIVNGNTQVNAGDIMNLPIPQKLFKR